MNIEHGIKEELATATDPIPLQDLESHLITQLSMGEMGAVLAVECCIAQGVQHGCSDVYLEPRQKDTLLRFRIDGALQDIAHLPKDQHERMVARAKILARLPAYQHDTPLDGRIESSPQWGGRSLRVATLPTVEGEKIVFRVVDAERAPFRVAELGFRKEVVDQLLRVVQHPHGTLLLTGPSSNGKTTTIYSLLAHLLERDNRSHILTVEDPVEYRMDGVTQTQVNMNAGYDYENALRALLRQDPDVLVIGEIRDKTTAQAAIQAGLTGHLVLSTVHSGTAAGVFTRLLDMDVEPFLLASSVNGVLAQRLVRKNCPKCLEAYSPPEHLVDAFGLKANQEFKRGDGCEACNELGYRGRTVIGEFLSMTDVLGEKVLDRQPTRSIQETAVDEGMVTILQHGLEKVRTGLTTLEELQFVVSPRELNT